MSRKSLYSLQIAVALSGIVCCGPSAEAQMIICLATVLR